ncbi:MAG: alternative ribosome rescue aminoacyl-tRNA hydrolase ArfB [Candidatus Falkowbacteria bacterium]
MVNNKSSRVPLAEVSESFSRSSGKGGQNVNKLETKVELRWNIGASLAFDEAQKQMIRLALQNRINSADEVVIFCQEERTQGRNRELAFEKLNQLVARAIVPIKKRRPTKPTHASKEKRLALKKAMTIKKKDRKKIVKVESI